MVFLISKIMKKLSGEIPSGFFLTKVEVISESNLTNSSFDFCSARIVKYKATDLYSYFICEGEGLGDNEVLLKIKFSLMKGSMNSLRENNNDKLNYLLDKYESSLIVSSKEVENFCSITEDDNYIHRGERPVVPGLFIIDKVLGGNNTNMNFYINFYKPVYAEQEIFIKRKKNEILGICEDFLCFKIKINQGEVN